jgi:predicted ABC-type ATPase
MPQRYIIAGCNGAGKTTASMTLLPEVLGIREFVNADAIASGLSPLNPEGVAIEAGKLMLNRIYYLMSQGLDFAIETTLSTKSYQGLVQKAKKLGYEITLLFLWLNSPELAKERVKSRVQKGGHNIPDDVIERRYWRGIQHLTQLFIPICEKWYVYDNSEERFSRIADFEKIYEVEVWQKILTYEN